jgi:molybdopterin/thiamine biosynthesis adenylyltransferase
MKFTNNDYQRYAKQILLKKIGVAGQKKVMSTKVLVIGVGGLGCPLILYLANSGIRNLGIVDHDKVDISNLNRQVLFTTSDVGKFKVLQAQKIVKKINNKIKVQIYKKKINKKNIKNIISKYDIICDGTDNFETRYLINDNCLKYKKVLISAAISKFDGQIFNFNFKKKTPCYRCFMPEIPNEEINCENDGVMSTLAGIAGTLQANEVMNSIISNKQSANTKMLIFNSISSEYRKVRLSRNPNCIKECIKK